MIVDEKNFFLLKCNMITKKLIAATPIFILFFGISNYNFQESKFLFVNPLQLLEPRLQHLQESPITFLIGYIINSILNNTSITYWLVVFLGYVYLFTILYLYEKHELNGDYFIKSLFFTPFFLIIFSWMGKPDTFLVGSFLSLVVFKNNIYLSFLSILILVFSHPQIAFIYLFLIFILKIFELRLFHFTSFLISYFLYFYYQNLLMSDIDGRLSYIIENIEKINIAFFVYLISGIISLFLWLWIPIINSKMFNNFKFSGSFLIIFSIAYLSVDFTRTFITMAIPLIIYLSRQEFFIQKFDQVFSNSFIYILGFFQIQKRPYGVIADSSWTISSITSENYYEILNKIGKLLKDILLYIDNLI